VISSLGGRKTALVISDMAPNITGVKSTDQAGSIYLAELALDLAHNVLDISGNILIKVFQGEGFDELVKQLRQSFTRVLIRKPKASRPKSREVYLLALGYKKTDGVELLIQ
jgi:23S rRNA (uridine2552-2'-O)-methyltransferase